MSAPHRPAPRATPGPPHPRGETSGPAPAPARDAPQAPVQLRIGRLSITGFSLQDPGAVGPALTAELERLIAGGGVPPGLMAGAPLPALDVSPEDARSGRALGIAVARAIYRGGAR